eukprot:SRR837773.4807.p1 GENE.SRR837773.4807~~SRR837773.4807.p1  ORF type:complete len:395 (-),score=66.43 SRR837773.4807:9-1088(-)
MGDAAKLAARGQEVWRLRLSAWSACALLAIQVAGGVWANSAALFAQTLQLVSEANEGVMAICALELMSKRATAECTFGLQQAGALGTFLTILLIWLLGMVLLVQDMHRFIHLEVVDGAMVMVFAAAGLFFHLLVERIVGSHRVDLGATLSARDSHIGASRSATSPSGDRGVPTTALSQLAAHSPVPGRPPLPGPRGRDLDGGGPPPSRSIRFSDGAEEERHIDPRVAGGRQAGFSVATDILFTLLVMAAGGLSWWQPFASFEPVSGVSRWCYADLFVAVLVTGRTIMSTTGAMNEALMQLLMACPRHFNLNTFQKSMRQLEGVVSLHDLHVWQLGRTRLCTAHLVVSDSSDPHEGAPGV